MSEDILASYPLPLVPIKSGVVFPGLSLSMQAFEGFAPRAIEQAMSRPDKSLLAVSLRPGLSDEEHITAENLFTIGTKAVITRMAREGNSMNVVLTGVERMRIDSITPERDYLVSTAHSYPISEASSPETEALQREILKTIEQIRFKLGNEQLAPLFDLVQHIHQPMIQLFLSAVLLGMQKEKQQELLECLNWHQAAEFMHSYVSYESKVLEIRHKISEDVAGELGKEQRDYVLRRQMAQIKKELGDEKGDKGELRVLRERLRKAKLPPEARAEAKNELRRLSRLTENSAEFQVHQAHLEFILDLPWQELTEDNLDLSRAEAVLNEDHYGLKDVKQRILEHLAVLRLNPGAKGPILCFVGPPGVGKTSLGQSIARALGRNFERMSLGGLHDEAELRGHRRTYIGAMPGRILRAIQRAKTQNPLLMLDEVDKLRSDFLGDPAAALMEILDPAQNRQFHDNYLDLPFDLSKVFFITTANTTDHILPALLDRMELIHLSGYTDDEKSHIARQYLIPRQLAEAGLKLGQLSLSETTLLEIIHSYTREAGVRELERCFGRITRKIAVRMARGENGPLQLEEGQLTKFLGQKRIFMEQLRERWMPGVAIGLAWTEAGGDIIYVETRMLPHRKKDLKITGNLGEVMRESAQTALSFIWSQTDLPGLNLERVLRFGLHMHIPAGAIPKDGPSAGLAIAVALASLYAGCPVRKDLAMTGEITLSGLVLPVGGIKEKILAARRARLVEVILPKANMKELEELPKDVIGAIKIFAVEDIEEALMEAIPGLRAAPPKRLENTRPLVPSDANYAAFPFA